MFPHHIIHKYTWNYSAGKKNAQQNDYVWWIKDEIQAQLMSHLIEELTVILIIW
jgi:hypothetical protein